MYVYFKNVRCKKIEHTGVKNSSKLSFNGTSILQLIVKTLPRFRNDMKFIGLFSTISQKLQNSPVSEIATEHRITTVSNFFI